MNGVASEIVKSSSRVLESALIKTQDSDLRMTRPGYIKSTAMNRLGYSLGG